MTTENLWIIKSLKTLGFYYGALYPTRDEAIRAHAKAWGFSWKKCYRRGDRAVRVVVVERAIL
jgi:hypothetical protein